MLRRYKFTIAAVVALLAIVLIPLGVQALVGGTTNLVGLIRIFTDTSFSTPSVATAGGDLYAEGTVEADGNLNIAGTGTITGASTLTGAVTASTSLTTPIAATALATIRFCGNGSATGIADYMGPVLLDDTEADLAFGGAGCDALNSATEATADASWHAGFAFVPVAMTCVGMCTGATTANDAIAYQLRDDAASVTGVACTAPAWTADAQAKQCSVRIATAATVAANSAIAVRTTGTDDACADAGDDFECLLFVTFSP